MDGVMDAGGGEKMRVQIWGRKRSSFPVELNLRLGCSTQLCLFSYQALSSGSKPASKRPMPLNPQLTHSLFLFLSLTFWLTPIFPLFIFLTLIDYPLPLAMPYLRSLSLSPPLLGIFSSLPVVQSAVG